MKTRLVRLIGWSTVWALSACGDKPTEVELRLYPCDLMSAPTSVELAIQSYGADGKLGEPLAKAFPIADQDVFSDGFATVGFTPPAGTLTADITVVWVSGGEEAVATYNVTVPAVGESLVLGKDECEPAPGTTTMPTTGSTTEPGTSDPTMGTGTDSTTSTTSTTETTSTTSTNTSTGETETSTDSTTTSTTSTDTTDSTTGTTGGEVMVGGDCDSEGILVCDGGAGVLGDLLKCELGKWALRNDLCPVSACAELGFVDPQTVGCFGSVDKWSCACADTPKGECTMGMQSQCGGPLSDGVLVELCVEDGDNTWHYAAQCTKCVVVDGQPLCTW